MLHPNELAQGDLIRLRTFPKRVAFDSSRRESIYDVMGLFWSVRKLEPWSPESYFMHVFLEDGSITTPICYCADDGDSIELLSRWEHDEDDASSC